MQRNTILHGDAWELAKTLPDNSVNCVVTSPPYFGLRSYLPEGHTDKGAEFGCEDTPELFVDKLVGLFRELRRALRHDGVLFLNLGDSYNGSGGAGGDYAPGGLKDGQPKYPGRNVSGLKPKDLIGIPWRAAFALQADGWWLRSEIIWHKRAPMPESVTDRPTKAHEQVFLLSKSPRYFYDADAVRERGEMTPGENRGGSIGRGPISEPTGKIAGFNHSGDGFISNGTRNLRSVWTLGPEPQKAAHFATFPTALVRPMILAGCPAEVCAACGNPWVRVVERETGVIGEARGYHVNAPRPNGNQLPVAYAQAKVFANSTQLAGNPKHAITTGFSPTCTCDVYACDTCGEVVRNSSKENIEYATQRPRASESLQAGMATPEVCDRPGIQREKEALGSTSSEGLRSVPQGVYGAQEQPLLQPEMFSRLDDRQRVTQQFPDREKGDVSQEHNSSGVCNDTQSGSSQRATQRTDTRTSNGDVGDPGAASAPLGESTPHQRHKNGQQAREFDVDGDKSSSRRSDLSVLRSEIPHSLTCPHCGGNLRPHTVPGITLDPFMGSGTTGAVARSLGRDYVGFELNSEYVKLAEQRIGKTQPPLFVA